MSDEREIIDVDNYRVIEVREEPLDDTQPPLSSQPPVQQWTGQTYTKTVRGGNGCCCSFSLTLIILAVIFMLGMCFLIYLAGRAIGWAIPGL